MQMCPYITPAHLLPNGRRNMIKPSSTGIHYVKYVLHISQTQETSETLSLSQVDRKKQITWVVLWDMHTKT